MHRVRPSAASPLRHLIPGEQRSPHLVTGMASRESPLSLLATSNALQPLNRRGKRGCIDFDLKWATFMVNFTRAANSAHQFIPSLSSVRKWDSFFTWGSTAVWRPDTCSCLGKTLHIHSHSMQLTLCWDTCESLQSQFSLSIREPTDSTKPA